MVLNVESEVAGGVKVTTARVLDFLLKRCVGLPLDVTPLSKLVGSS
jgi:hypothetical protein